MLWVDAVGLGALDGGGGGGGGGGVVVFCFDLWEEESDDGAFDSCFQALDRGSCAAAARPAASVVAAFLALVVAASTTIASAAVVAVSFARQVRQDHAVADTSASLDELGGFYSGYVPCADAFFI